MSKQGGWESTGFGARLRGLRESADFTQQQLADKAGCHKQTIVKLERGEQEPAWPLVLALAAALAVDCKAFTGPTAADAPQPVVGSGATDEGHPSGENPARKKKMPRKKGGAK